MKPTLKHKKNIIKIFLLLFFISCNFFSKSQVRDKEYIIDFNSKKYKKNKKIKYGYLEFINSRADTNYIGLGARLIGKAFAQNFTENIEIFYLEKSIKNQVVDIFKTMVDNTTIKDTLVFQLLQFYIAAQNSGGPNGEPSIKNETKFRANFFAKKNNVYYPLKFIDTTITPKILTIHPTRYLLKKGYKMFIENLHNCIGLLPIKMNGLTKYDLTKHDSIAKSKMPLFINSTLLDGLYNTYTDFKSQVPNAKVFVKFDENTTAEIDKAYEINEEGEMTKVNKRNVYAIVYLGIPYVIDGRMFRFNYYKLEKKNNSFGFVALINPRKLSTKNAAIHYINGSARFTSSIRDNPYCDVTLDYMDGSFLYNKIWWENSKNKQNQIR